MIYSFLSKIPCFKTTIHSNAKRVQLQLRKSQDGVKQNNQEEKEPKNSMIKDKQIHQNNNNILEERVENKNITKLPEINGQIFQKRQPQKINQKAIKNEQEEDWDECTLRQSIETTKSKYIMNDVNKQLTSKEYDPNESINQHCQLWDIYTQLELIGEGTFASVYKVKHIITNHQYALKIYKTSADNKTDEHWDALTHAQNQIRTLQELKLNNVQNVIELIDYKLDVQYNQYYLILEYLPMNLRTFLHNNGKDLTHYEQKKIIRQIVEGVKGIHQCKFIHRDLKPQNILIDHFCVVKIADFGMASLSNKPFIYQQPINYQQAGTLRYNAPELLLGSISSGNQVDLWSLGMILGEIFIGKQLIQGQNNADQLKKICALLKLKLNVDPTPNTSAMNLSLSFQTSSTPSLSTLFKNQQIEELIIVESLLKIHPQQRETCENLLESYQYFLKNDFLLEIQDI